MQYYLKYTNGEIKNIKEDNVLDELYLKLAVLPSEEELKKYVKNPKEYLKEVKIKIAKITKYIPLFDIYTKNLYIINPENIYFRIMEYNYRLPDKFIVKNIQDTINDYTKKKIKNKFINDFLETLNKNIKFLNCFDLPTLKETFYKIYYDNNPQTKDITSCIRPSYLPFFKNINPNIKPYFTKTELKMLSLNMKLDIDNDNDNDNDICDIVSKNDIDSKNLMYHLIYIKENYGAKNFIQLYTLLGSFYLNNYLRNKSTKDTILEKELNNIWSIIRKAPKFDKEYYMYRFIDNDDFLVNLNVGDIYDEPSFISTTRNPFYDPKNNVFGYVLIKIKIPKNIEGIGLCIESYSLFPQEQEILLAPGKLKLIGIDNDFEYYHTNHLAAKKINKKYEFEYIKPSDKLISFDSYLFPDKSIPHINFFNQKLEGMNFKQKGLYFMEECICKINNKYYFYSNIGKTKYLFQFYKLDTSIVYNRYFFLQKDNTKTEDEFYIIIQDNESAIIKLFIEIKDIISVNYIFRSLGSENYFDHEELILFISYLAKAFSIDEVIIHDNYISYENITETNLVNIDYNDFNIDFNRPDTHSMNLFSGYSQFYPEELINYIYSIRRHKPYTPKYHNIIGFGIRILLPYYRIDELSYVKSDEILSFKEKTFLNKILNKNIEKCLYILDFYIFIHENYFYLINELNECINRYFLNIGIEDLKENPWNINYFILRPYEYLYHKGIISYLPINKDLLSDNYLNKLNTEKNINNRIRYYY
jgi:hypothetical protein